MVFHLFLIALVAVIPVYCDIKLQPYPISDLKISSLTKPVDNALFGDDITITFSALEETWDLDLKRLDLVSPDAKYIGQESTVPLRSHVYSSPRGQFPFMRVTVFDRDLIKGKLVKESGDVYLIVPPQNFPDKSLLSGISEKMIIYFDPNSEPRHERSLLQSNFRRFTDGDGCYVGQEKRRKMKIGIFADIGFRKRIDKLYGVENSKDDLYLQQVLQDYVAQMNEVYRAQFNIELELTALDRQPASANLPFNQEPTTAVTKDGKSFFVCPDPKKNDGTALTTNDQFDYFYTWKNIKDEPLYWTLFTDCQPFEFDAKHAIARAYQASLCKKQGAMSLVSYIPTDIGETWAAYAYALGVSFGGEPGSSPGLLNDRVGTRQYNGYSPQLINPNDLSNYQGRMQYDLAYRPKMCETINAYINGLKVTAFGQQYDTANCFVETNKVYQWATTNCSKTPAIACTCYCNGLGVGYWTSRYTCQDALTLVEAEDENCIYPKPQGNTEMCDFAALNNGIKCPGIDPPAPCAGGTPNNIVEEGEECDLGLNSKCCSNCRTVTSGDCVRFTKVRDAAFNLQGSDNNTMMNYVFQGRNYAIYTDIDTQKFGGPKPFLRPIKGDWKNLDPFFYGGIDAVVQNTLKTHPKYGFFYMFKAGKVTEYHIDNGESFGWPKDIKNSIFSSIKFSTGPPNAQKPIDAALSFGAVVWFFQGIEASKYTWGQLKQDDIYPLSMVQQFSLPREHFFAGASAVIYYHNAKQADFFSKSGVRIRWSSGGVVGTATTNDALGVATSSNANTVKCPASCTSCTTAISCEVCDLGYELVTGVCYERAYFLQLLFNSNGITTTYAEDMNSITETSLKEENWGKIPAVNGRGVEFGKNGGDYIKIRNPGRRNILKDYEISFWIKFTSSRDSTLFTAQAAYTGRTISLQIPVTKVDDETFSITFVFGGTSIPHPTKCKINSYMHIIVGLKHSVGAGPDPIKAASISIDGVFEERNINEVDDDGNIVRLSDFAELKDMQIGAQSNSIVAVLDEFKIQNSDIPATNRFLNDSSHLNPSWLCIFLFIFALLSFN